MTNRFTRASASLLAVVALAGGSLAAVPAVAYADEGTPIVQANKTVEYVKPTWQGKNGQANDKIVIPNVTGINYTIKSDLKTAQVTPGTYNVTDFSAFPGHAANVEVTAKPAKGYTLTQNGKSVSSVKTSVTFSGIYSMAATAPTFKDLDGTANDTFTIPSKSGVTYQVGGKTLKKGTYKVTDYTTYKKNKASITVNAVANDGYELTGTTTWMSNYTGTSNIKVEWAAPTWQGKNGKANDKIVIPNVTGINYTIKSDLKTQQVAPGTYNVTDFSAFPGHAADVEVTGTPAAGYTLTQNGKEVPSAKASVTFSGIYSMAATAPTFSDQDGVANDTFTIPSKSGVTYQVGGKTLKKGTYKVSDYATYKNGKASITVNAVANDGYALTGTTTWMSNFTGTAEATYVKPTWSDANGRKNDKIVIPNVPGINYTIKGDLKTEQVAPGTYATNQYTSYPDDCYGTIQVIAQPASGYTLIKDGKAVSSVTASKSYSGIATVSPTAPTFDDQDGTANDTFTIPSKTGVAYQVGGKTLKKGTYKVANYATYSNGQAILTVNAIAKESYLISGQSAWTKAFSGNNMVTAVMPQVATGPSRLVVPDITGVQYYVNGKAVPAGDYIPADSDYDANGKAVLTITAKAKSGYELTNPGIQWSATFTRPVPSDQTVTTKAPTFNDAAGEANDTIVIPAVTGVQYKVNGMNVAAGTYKVSNLVAYQTADNGQRSVTVTVTASAMSGYKITGTTQWVKDPFWGDVATAYPVEPAWNDRSGEGSDTYTIPTVNGVRYTVNGLIVTGVVTVPTTEYKMVNGVRQATVTVKASKGDGLWKVTEQTYTHTFTGNQTSKVTPAAPSQIDNVGETSDTYTIPSQANVNYYVDGYYKAPGTYTLSTYFDYKSAGNLKPRTAAVKVEARAASSEIELTGTTSWTLNFTGNKETASTQPGFEAKYVGFEPKALITTPNIEGVQYSIDGVNVEPGTHTTTYGVTHLVKATAKTGYVLTSYINEWSLSSGGGGGGDTIVYPIKPTFSDNQGTANDTVTIPTVTGAKYTVNNIEVQAGTYNVKNFASYVNGIADITVEAHALPGYSISGTYKWWQQFSDGSGGGGGGDQGHIVDTNLNPPTNWISGMNGYYQIPSVTGIDFYVDGVKTPAGTYTVTYAQMPKQVTVEAKPWAGYSIKSGSNYMWRFSFYR